MLIDCNKAEIAIGKRPNSALGAMLQAYLPTPSMYLQYRVCIFSGRKESKVFSRTHSCSLHVYSLTKLLSFDS